MTARIFPTWSVPAAGKKCDFCDDTSTKTFGVSNVKTFYLCGKWKCEDALRKDNTRPFAFIDEICDVLGLDNDPAIQPVVVVYTKPDPKDFDYEYWNIASEGLFVGEDLFLQVTDGKTTRDVTIVELMAYKEFANEKINVSSIRTV